MKDILSKLAVRASTSTAFSINTTDLKKVLINALMVGASTAVLYMSSNLSSVSFGALTPVIVPLVTAGLELVYRYLKNNSPKDE